MHDQLIRDLERFSADFTDSSFSEFKYFFYSWLINHVLGEDKKYFHYSNQQKRRS